MSDKQQINSSALLRNNTTWAAQQPSELFKELSKGQSPNSMVICCCDSRMSPTIFDAGLGSIFVHRNVANQVNTSDESMMAALEYAVCSLNVQDFIVCGHTNCGGVGGALQESVGLKSVDAWIEPIRNTKSQHESELSSLSPKEQTNRLVELNVLAQLTLLKSLDLFSDLETQNLNFYGWVFDLSTGLVRDITPT